MDREEQTHSQALVLMGDFNHPNICWRDNRAGHKQSKRILEDVDHNFLLQVREETTGKGTQLGFILNNKGLVGNVVLQRSLVCSNCEIMELEVLRAARRAHITSFGLTRDFLGKVPWNTSREEETKKTG